MSGALSAAARVPRRTAPTGAWTALRARLAARRRLARPLGIRTIAAELGWDGAATISVAGVHGGAGATTLALLLANAIAGTGSGAVVCVDLAGRARGGLAVLGGAAGQTTAEGTAAAAALPDGTLDRPFGVTAEGLRILGTHPDGVESLDRGHETLVARLVEAIDGDADDARLARLARLAASEQHGRQALRWDNEQAAAAVAGVLDRALAHHALVVIDLGMLDSDQLAAVVARRSDLHVWVLPSRPHSLEIARRRLPLIEFEPAGAEAVAVWRAAGHAPSARRLAALGDLRGCPAVRIADHGGGDDWRAMAQRSLPGLIELCDLAR